MSSKNVSHVTTNSQNFIPSSSIDDAQIRSHPFGTEFYGPREEIHTKPQVEPSKPQIIRIRHSRLKTSIEKRAGLTQRETDVMSCGAEKQKQKRKIHQHQRFLEGRSAEKARWCLESQLEVQKIQSRIACSNPYPGVINIRNFRSNILFCMIQCINYNYFCIMNAQLKCEQHYLPLKAIKVSKNCNSHKRRTLCQNCINEVFENCKECKTSGQLIAIEQVSQVLITFKDGNAQNLIQEIELLTHDLKLQFDKIFTQITEELNTILSQVRALSDELIVQFTSSEQLEAKDYQKLGDLLNEQYRYKDNQLSFDACITSTIGGLHNRLQQIDQFYKQFTAKADQDNQPKLQKKQSKQNLYFEEANDAEIDENYSKSEREKRPPFTFKSGAIYEGEWRGTARDGYGVQIWPDGAKYEGNWLKNRAHGYGKFIHADGDVYEGEWELDKACGFGTYLHSNGATYKGRWMNDVQHGIGKETWADGSCYDGEYVGGQKNGKGLYLWGDGSKYEGDWKNNKIEGVGTYYWVDGRKYIGEWADNQMHGKGVYTWPDGRKYEGDYKYDKKSGRGVYYWADGRKYDGEWNQGKQHGIGIYYTSGQKRVGEWIEGKRTRWLE